MLPREQLQQLVESAKQLSAEVNLEVLLRGILEKASELTASPDSSVILKHQARPALYVAAATGKKANDALASFGRHSPGTIPLEGSKAGRVFTTRKPFFENAVTGHFEGVDHEVEQKTQSMVCVPLEVAGDAIGVMQVLNRRVGAYGQADVVLLEHLAALAAVAIRNARLFEAVLAHSGVYKRVSGAAELQSLVEELEGRPREERLTVLFADMRGFTQLVQSLGSAERVQARLNEFVSMLVDEILRMGGVVNKMMGDGVMALFRAEDHEERAVRAAFNMQERFDSLKVRWDNESSEELAFLDLGVGIVTDDVMLGAIGTEDVRDYTAIGSGVNLAASFEQNARGENRILVNHLAWKAVKDLVESEQLDSFELKKPDQDMGVKHKCYALRELRLEAAQQVFISHATGDETFVAERLVKPLAEKRIKTWVATQDVAEGARWAQQIHDGLSQSTWMVVVVSKSSKGSRWVRREVDAALEMENLADRIIPICLDDTRVSDVSGWLATVQAIDAEKTRNVAAAIAKRIRERSVSDVSGE